MSARISSVDGATCTSVGSACRRTASIRGDRRLFDATDLSAVMRPSGIEAILSTGVTTVANDGVDWSVNRLRVSSRKAVENLWGNDLIACCSRPFSSSADELFTTFVQVELARPTPFNWTEQLPLESRFAC